MTIIYHNKDLDGFCSGAICKYKYPDAIFIGWDYGDPIPEIPDGPVILTDISFPMDVMREIASKHELTWIDHHKTAIEEYNAGEPFCNAILVDGIAACELTWKYLFPNESVPKFVSLIGLYDTWRNYGGARWYDETLPFQYGMRSICNSIDTFPFILFANDDGEIVNSIIVKGQTILKYIKASDELTCKNGAFEIEVFNGLRAICLNNIVISSTTFQSVYDESKHDIMVGFAFNGNAWRFSLRSTKPDVDVSEIARLYGGGGHKAAAGFEVKNLVDVFTI